MCIDKRKNVLNFNSHNTHWFSFSNLYGIKKLSLPRHGRLCFSFKCFIRSIKLWMFCEHWLHFKFVMSAFLYDKPLHLLTLCANIVVFLWVMECSRKLDASTKVALHMKQPNLVFRERNKQRFEFCINLRVFSRASISGWLIGGLLQLLRFVDAVNAESKKNIVYIM